MTQEKTGLDCVCCPISDCKKIFTRRELVQLGNLLVIPEHRDPSTEAVCRGCFKEPNEMVDVNLPSRRKSRKRL